MTGHVDQAPLCLSRLSLSLPSRSGGSALFAAEAATRTGSSRCRVSQGRLHLLDAAASWTERGGFRFRAPTRTSALLATSFFGDGVRQRRAGADGLVR